MSRDIRSYFVASKSQASKSSKISAVILSDEEDKKTSKMTKKAKITEKRRRKHALSDSEDEETDVKKIKSKKEESKIIENHKTVNLSDVFGKVPIKRVPAPKIIKKTDESKNSKAEVKPEIGFHDDDLDSSLIELDEALIEQSLAIAEEKKKGETKSRDEALEKNKEMRDSDRKEKERPKTSSDSSPEKQIAKKEEKLSKHRESKSNGVKRKAKNKSSKLEIDENEKDPKKVKLNESTDMFEEIIEKKKQSAALYQQFLHRGGARNPGSKEIPEGAEYCLAGLSFLITGVLDSLERDEADEIIKKYGGRILHQVSRKTDYVIAGDQPGPAKLAKAESMKIPIISEDDLLNLIRTRPAGRSISIKQSHSKPKVTIRPRSPDPESIHPITPPKNEVEALESDEQLDNSDKSYDSKESKYFKNAKDLKKSPEKTKKEIKVEPSTSREDKYKYVESDSKQVQSVAESRTEALVEKYRPQTLKQLIGQQGDKSNAKKLYSWLNDWYKNRSSSIKHSKPTPWAKNDNGAFFKAALLSGSPGIGKTSTVYVVARELGFDLLEFNASDTRSKKLLKDEVAGLLSNTTVKGYFTGDKSDKLAKKHVLLMDEVDGMAGNEDRGGLQELITLIKSTEIPIICICNDRNNPKMRTLANYTYDLRFLKPRIEQIKGAMMSLCFKEKINIKSEEMNRLIESTNQDIRQVINHLALLSASIDNKNQTDSNRLINKDLKLGPWDVVRKVFSADEHKKMSIHDKSDLFFHDYSIAPLFVQENYLSVSPHAPKNELLERVAKSADSLSLGDLVENAIRGIGSWSLLPTQAMFSSVIPGFWMSGHITNQTNFPSWLGRNSKRNKMDRLLQEITVHTRLTTGASKEAINLDYLPSLRDIITRPLISEDVETALNVMNQYHLTREDFDSILEVSLWPGNRNPMQFIESKVKSAFTRAYNKNAATAPYAMTAGVSKKKKVGAAQDDEFEGLEDGEDIVDSAEEEDDIDIEKMVKAKKPSSKKGSTKDEEKPSSSKKAASSKDEEKPKKGKGKAKAK